MNMNEDSAMSYRSQDAFEAGVRTRETVGKVAEGARRVKRGTGNLIGGGITNVTEGLRESADAVADSTAIIAKTGLQNQSGFFRGLCAIGGFLVIGAGLSVVIPRVLDVGAGFVIGASSQKPVNTQNGFVGVSSAVGAGSVRAVSAVFGTLGNTAQTYYEYKEVQNQNPQNSNPSFVGGNIRAGGINPYPQQQVIPIQMQAPQQKPSYQQPYQPVANNIRSYPYNPNVYQPSTRR